MKDTSPISIGWRPILAHAVTVVVTLILVAVLFGDRLGLRRPPLAQIRGVPNERMAPVPPAPQPIEPSSRAFSEPGDSTAGSRSTPPPPEDMLKGLDPDERANIRVYSAVNRSVVNITTEAEGLGFFGDETSSGSGSVKSQFRR